ncbi:MAG: YbjQ family protein [Acidimicrobiia bacterium]|nr:YbjQ family protein [Acidimicrobiia bacterium]
MILTTSHQVDGKTVLRSIGIAKGSTIRAKHVGKDIVAAFRNIAGGEIVEYTEMMAEAREEATQRMVDDATKQGANAVIGMRFTTSMVMQNAAEVLAYGTAVIVE